MQGTLEHLQDWMPRKFGLSRQPDERPLRGELLGSEQLASHARAVASGHSLSARNHGSNQLLARLERNEKGLRDFNTATLAVDTARRITPAAEWLLDNFFLIDEQVRLARRHLPRSYNRELPRLAKGPSAGFPRVYDLVLELISHVDAQIDAGQLTTFVSSYQSVAGLKLGELWAIPIMLRLALIENLHRITLRLAVARKSRDLADAWVDRLRRTTEANPSRLVVAVAEMATSSITLDNSFVAEFSQRLARGGTGLNLARGWLDQRLAEGGQSVELMVQQEGQGQAADQVSVSHCIASLRFLGANNWKDFVEDQSFVEKTLRLDPAGVYSLMDFATRDRYRHVVERLARQGGLREDGVARSAIDLASERCKERGALDRSSHVGYFLIDKGAPALVRRIGLRLPWSTIPCRFVRRFPQLYYIGSIGVGTAAATLGFARLAMRSAIPNWQVAFLVAAFALGASQLAVALVNRFSTWLLKPDLLPRLDFASGIAPDCRTMVVIPTMLTSVGGVDSLIEKLEIHHLSNRDDRLHFALLTDFRDSEAEAEPEDAALLTRAKLGVQMLNKRYPHHGEGFFFLMHRPRRWNKAEGLWMGYERKRGKLAELNALLRGTGRERFDTVVGETSVLPEVRFVITLDTDTDLPRDVCRQLAGTISHPLNRAVFDAKLGIVTEGYGILQPRVGVSLPSARQSLFVRLFAGDVGVDPYTREVSDVYQDLFHEGSYIGKGIYDVDAFQKSLEGRFPENTILSHDLLESCHARSAIVSDLELYENHPSRYNVEVDRRRRWIRGDWQIVQWLLPRVPGPQARWVANPLSCISQWKILDNLRRSLVPIALALFLVGSWLLPAGSGAMGSSLVLALVMFPGLLAVLSVLVFKPSDQPASLHLRVVAGTFSRQLAQSILALTFLPYDAVVSADAVCRTLIRLFMTRRLLLQWRTSGESESTLRSDVMAFVASMWVSPAVGLTVGVAVFLFRPASIAAAFPMLSLWLAAPWIAWWISKPIVPEDPQLTVDQVRFLRHSARMTWHFFETFVNEGENWIPPDNFQEVPSPKVASRTSPTNLGLALLANLAAADLGYLSSGGLVRRTRDALATMNRLERYRGHFFNWYDTRTLAPLPPNYISSVDSGNLAGHLLTLGSGLREMAGERILNPAMFAGLLDTAGVLKALVGEHAALSELEAEFAAPPQGLRASLAILDRATAKAAAMGDAMAIRGEAARRWILNLRKACQEHADDLRLLAPWVAEPGLLTGGGMEAAPRANPPEAVGASSPSPSHSNRGKWAMFLDKAPTLREIAEFGISVSLEPGDGLTPEAAACLRRAGAFARERILKIEELASQCERLAQMDFTFLFDAKRNLFSTGYNVTDRRLDSGYYDLLASEARLCSYVAIALGQIPQDHWFSLGRLLVVSMGEPVLVSWSGSMFEYLMPLLVMPSFERTLLHHTYRAAVRQQIEYGRARGVPWGISESGYNRTDADLNYQYRAFGVPGLGLKRGLSEDLVIAPYASALALMVDPSRACENLQRLAADDRSGSYGFYEAVDFTPERLPPDETSVTIRSYMAHHQGMSLLALDNLLLKNPMHRRFLSCPVLKAAELLLQERIPRASKIAMDDDLDVEPAPERAGEEHTAMRVCTNPSLAAPDVHLLSNGRYHVMVTSAGGGYSRWRDLAVTRWNEDATLDCWGTFVYVRDCATGELWSAAHQPTRCAEKSYEAIFTTARAEFRQSHSGIDVHTDICVSPEDDVELRRVTITNRSASSRVIELTSYAEIVLATPASDAAHPAFSNLFVQTEFMRNPDGVLCTRRARSPEEHPPWLVHLMVTQGGAPGPVSCETDRLKFIGRGGTLAKPAAMNGCIPLSNTVGPVLDPIVSLRRTFAIAPDDSVVVDLIMGVASTRAEVVGLLEKYQGFRMTDRAFDLAWTHSQVTLRQLDASEGEAQLFGRLAAALVYADPSRRADPGLLARNRRSQSALWSFGVSGDLPIVTLRISGVEHFDIASQLIKAHAFLRVKGLPFELVILDDEISIYRQSLHEQIVSLLGSGASPSLRDSPGGIFVRSVEQVSEDDRVLLAATARVYLNADEGTLAEQLEHTRAVEPGMAALVPVRGPRNAAAVPMPKRDLIYSNGLGGFTKDGHEYVITLEGAATTPAPWVNVLANPLFGTVVSEAGSGYTWSENAHEYRLTPWSDDPVRDTPGEAFFIRDEFSGQYWSPCPLPARGNTPYVVRHGFGYTVFEHTENGISSEFWVYVSMDAPVKLMVLRLRNVSERDRRVSTTGFWEWVLGEQRPKNQLHIRTEIDLKTGALLARNPFNIDFQERIAFIDVSEAARTVTGDRREFIGRNGSLAKPAAMERVRLSGKVGAGLDPCGAMQVVLDIPVGAEREVSYRMGVGHNLDEVLGLLQRFRASDSSRTELEGVWRYWNHALGAVNVDTPDPSVNVLVNGWLLYQTLGARLWGRTGFYQSGGAFGFRDQLQDVMALVHAEPALVRGHLLRAAAHQFVEGDVQHWWHPPSGRGVRTNFSDDFLWLPYATSRYVSCVADTGVLDERVGFLQGRVLKPGDEAYYDLPAPSGESGTLYEHCVRAIERGLRFGSHGLPLIGCGDWNDGMNRVGIHGRGESVWLAFFLYDVLGTFAPLARAHGDIAFAERCLSQALGLRQSIESGGWDGAWYRRAYFDNGEPLGSQSDPECQIDSLPQSWSVISGAGAPERSRQAMESVDRRLVRRDLGLIRLLTPPFDTSTLNPGYISGYMPGVRENGGQYTQASIWAAIALAGMGESERAWEYFGILNPVRHSATPEQIAVYKVEPYVVAADVYSVAPHEGRGGWTWYTGSAGWMYRLIVESLIGVNVEGDRLRLAPLLPKAWPSMKVHYRFRGTVYHITVTRRQGPAEPTAGLTVDGVEVAGYAFDLKDDHAEHAVEARVN